MMHPPEKGRLLPFLLLPGEKVALLGHDRRPGFEFFQHRDIGYHLRNRIQVSTTATKPVMAVNL
jgi:hypothetical protein